MTYKPCNQSLMFSSWNPDPDIWVQGLARGSVLWSWARYFTPTVLFIQPGRETGTGELVTNGNCIKTCDGLALQYNC